MDRGVGTPGSPTARPVSSPAGSREGPAPWVACARSPCHPEAAVDAWAPTCSGAGRCVGPVTLERRSPASLVGAWRKRAVGHPPPRQRPGLSAGDWLPLTRQHGAGQHPVAVLDAGLSAGGRGRPGGGCRLWSGGAGGSSWAAGEGRPTRPACTVGPGRVRAGRAPGTSCGKLGQRQGEDTQGCS